jgi:hypothetical protein
VECAVASTATKTRDHCDRRRPAGLPGDTSGGVRETSAEDSWATVAHPPDSSQISILASGKIVRSSCRAGCSAAGDSSRIRSADRSSPGIGGGLGRMAHRPSSAPAVLVPYFGGCSDRRNDREQNGREDRGSKQDGYAVHKGSLHPPAGVPAPPLLSHGTAFGVARIHRKISALLLIRNGPWSIGVSALHRLGDGDHTSRTRSHQPLATAAPGHAPLPPGFAAQPQLPAVGDRSSRCSWISWPLGRLARGLRGRRMRSRQDVQCGRRSGQRA